MNVPRGAKRLKMRFTIPEVLPSQNRLLRMHFRARSRLRTRLAWMVKAALLESGYRIGSSAIERSRVTITRFCRRKLDPDNAFGSAKLLLDVLQPYSKTHPDGLGVIRDDSVDCIELTVQQEPGNCETLVEIEAI